MKDNGTKKMRESDIDAHLKRAFKELSDEGLPDRLTELLAQLKSRDAGPRDDRAPGAGPETKGPGDRQNE